MRIVLLLLLFLLSCSDNDTVLSDVDCAGISNGNAYINECGNCINGGIDYYKEYVNLLNDIEFTSQIVEYASNETFKMKYRPR